ncbi:MAG: hypothetical protein DMG49_27405 [Acidobacteria bacterium]|nr:MAG: hypothetical protein DMG49_27405 [Acidobacteriota bacterium]
MRRLARGFLFLYFVVGVRSVHSQLPQVAAPVIDQVHGERLHIAGISNAGKVADQLYRGGQPRIGSIGQLKKIGITTIVDLRSEDVGMRYREKKEADSLGIRFVSIPIGGWSTPTDDEVAEFLSLFGHSKERVFVHCRLGEDRTGVFVATYRIAVQKWTAERAISEMNLFGFNSFWHPAMMAFVRNFPARLTSVPAFAALSSPGS